MHKPEAMLLGICPKCHELKVCVMVVAPEQPAVYYVRKHQCGRRLLPVAGTLRELT